MKRTNLWTTEIKEERGRGKGVGEGGIRNKPDQSYIEFSNLKKDIPTIVQKHTKCQIDRFGQMPNLDRMSPWHIILKQ